MWRSEPPSKIQDSKKELVGAIKTVPPVSYPVDNFDRLTPVDWATQLSIRELFETERDVVGSGAHLRSEHLQNTAMLQNQAVDELDVAYFLSPSALERMQQDRSDQFEALLEGQFQEFLDTLAPDITNDEYRAWVEDYLDGDDQLRAEFAKANQGIADSLRQLAGSNRMTGDPIQDLALAHRLQQASLLDGSTFGPELEKAWISMQARQQVEAEALALTTRLDMRNQPQ